MTTKSFLITLIAILLGIAIPMFACGQNEQNIQDHASCYASVITGRIFRVPSGRNVGSSNIICIFAAVFSHKY
jgi:hypothetical protein